MMLLIASALLNRDAHATPLLRLAINTIDHSISSTLFTF